MKKRMDSMQALRFLACLCIFAHHCYITEVVYWGVSVFFVMSGFLMCCGYYDRYSASLDPAVSLRFSLKKLWKLYPLHVLTMLPILALDIYMRPSTGSPLRADTGPAPTEAREKITRYRTACGCSRAGASNPHRRCFRPRRRRHAAHPSRG